MLDDKRASSGGSMPANELHPEDAAAMREHPQPAGPLRQDISTTIVALFKQRFGRGPTTYQLASGTLARRAASGFGGGESRPGPGRQSLQIAAPRAGLSRALPGTRTMGLERPRAMADEVAQDAKVLVAHGRSCGADGIGNAISIAAGTAGCGSAMSNSR
jgi:hypothetical protein